MLSIFRTNNIFVSIFIFLYIIVLRLPSFWFKNDIWQPSSKGILSDWVYQILGSSNNWAATLLACVLLLFHSIIINSLVSRHKIVEQQTLFPGLFYVLAACTLPDFLYLSPILLANTFYLLAISNLFKVWRQSSAADNIFNVGLCIGIASLFYNSYIILVIWGIIGLNLLRKLNLKEWLILILGVLLPYIFVGTYYYWHDSYAFFVQKQFYDNYAFFQLYSKMDLGSYMKLGIFAVFVAIMLFSYPLYQTKKSTPITDYQSLIYWAMLFTGLGVFIQANVRLEYLAVLAVPIGFFISQNFLRLKNPITETLHLIWLFFVLFAQYKGLLGF